MALDDLRRRLEQLNRGPLPGGLKAAFEPPRTRRVRRPDGANVSLESLVPGRAVQLDGQSYYAIERSAEGGPPSEMLRRAKDVLVDRRALERAARPDPDLAAATEAGGHRLLFVDLETCGFSPAPVFLIGTMHVGTDHWHVEQLLARNYAEERAILTRFSSLLESYPYLVTFNGKSFDWPLLADRSAVARVPLPSVEGHCDVLHVARRRLKGVVPDCKLQTLEHYVCGRSRRGDIAGRDIPAAYHEFVRTADAREMRDIVHHNFLDLITLAEIVGELLGRSA